MLFLQNSQKQHITYLTNKNYIFTKGNYEENHNYIYYSSILYRM